MSKSIAHRIPGAGAMLLVALLSITLSVAACEDDAQSVRQVNESAAASTATAETPSPSAEIKVTELRDGDCINSTLPEQGISIDTVVIVPCSGDWQYRVLKSFQLADADPFPAESFFLSQVSENCDRQTGTYLLPSAQGWEQGYRTITCLQEAPELVISGWLEGLKMNAEDLNDDEASCLEEWMAGANLLAIVVTPDDPAWIDDFIAQLERCAPNLLGFATAVATPEPTSTATPSPTATAPPEPTPPPTPEPTAEPTATAPVDLETTDEANLWIAISDGEYDWLTVEAQTSFDVEEFDLDIFVDGEEYCNASRMYPDEGFYEMSCAVVEGSHRDVQRVSVQTPYGDLRCRRNDQSSATESLFACIWR